MSSSVASRDQTGAKPHASAPDREGRTMSTWMRRSGLAGLGALAAALVVLGAAGPAAAQASGPPDRATDHGKRQWRFDDTAATVSDVAPLIGPARLRDRGIHGFRAR